jgi:hypothetical protein
MIPNHQCTWTGNTSDPITIESSWTMRTKSPQDSTAVAAIVETLKQRIVKATIDVRQDNPATFTIQLTL